MSVEKDNEHRRFTTEELHKAFRDIYGYGESKSLKDDQLVIIRKILDKKDTLNILPTGSGKSACYLVPAKLFSGVTIVITPLISLMRDQIKKVKKSIPVAGLSAEFMFDKKGWHNYYKNGKEKECNSEEEYYSKRRIRDENIFLETIKGQEMPGDKDSGYKVIFVTPERLRTGQFIRFAKRANISMIAVDEAHCISLWGYEFRRRYLEIPRFMRRIGKRPVIAAFTATATPPVEKDIVDHLCFDAYSRFPDTKRKLEKRNNLHFDVQTISEKKRVEFFTQQGNVDCAEDGEKERLLEKIESRYRCGMLRNYAIDHKDEKGIIYCKTVSQVDLYYKYFKKKNELSVTRYYANLNSSDKKEKNESKEKNLNDFLSGVKKIMITTTALGMGIDKPDVHYVLHAGMSQSIENYYQEAGRAGRDKKQVSNAECILFYLPTDRIVCEKLIDRSIESSALEGDAKELRKSIALDRLDGMEKYCRMVLADKTRGCVETDPQDLIIDFFQTYKGKPKGYDDEKIDEIQEEIKKDLDSIDVLYVNRTKIAQLIRKGIMEDSDVKVGRAGTVKTAKYKIYGDKILYLDMMVADAVYTLIVHGVDCIYARSVMGLLSGDQSIKLRPERTEEINKSIRKMIKTKIRIDMKKSGKMGFSYDGDRAYWEDSFLPLKENGKGFSVIGDKLPPLYEYAEIMNGQFHSLPMKLLDVKLYNEVDGELKVSKTLPSSLENIAMKHYLLRRIDSMSKSSSSTRKVKIKGKSEEKIFKSVTSSTVKEETMLTVLEKFFELEDCRDDKSRNRKRKRIKEKEEQILTHFKKVGFIYDFMPATKIRNGVDTGIPIEDSIRIKRMIIKN